MSPSRAKALSAMLNFGACLIIPMTVLGLAKLLRPLPAWQPADVRLDQTTNDHSEALRPRLNASDLAVIWQRDLRQRLFDPPPKKAKPPQRPKLAIKLVGTALEASGGFGVFRLADNRTVVKPVGAIVDGFELVSVNRGRVTLRNGAREFELKVAWYERIRESERD